MSERNDSGSINITPDWDMQGTAGELEAELRSFVFKGVGWYITDEHDDTLLVLPTSDPDVFTVLVYNGRNPIEAFNRIINLGYAMRR